MLYSSCSFWGDSKKVQGSVVSNRTGMTFDRIHKYGTHRLTVSDFLTRRHNLKMVAMTSFHSELCCRLVNAHTASSQHLRSSARQFLIYSWKLIVLWMYSAMFCDCSCLLFRPRAEMPLPSDLPLYNRNVTNTTSEFSK